MKKWFNRLLSLFLVAIFALVPSTLVFADENQNDLNAFPNSLIMTIDFSDIHTYICVSDLPEGIVPIEMTLEEIELFIVQIQSPIVIELSVCEIIASSYSYQTNVDSRLPFTTETLSASISVPSGIPFVNMELSFRIGVTRNTLSRIIQINHHGWSLTGFGMTYINGSATDTWITPTGFARAQGWVDIRIPFAASGGIFGLTRTAHIDYTWQ